MLLTIIVMLLCVVVYIIIYLILHGPLLDTMPFVLFSCLVLLLSELLRSMIGAEFSIFS